MNEDKESTSALSNTLPNDYIAKDLKIANLEKENLELKNEILRLNEKIKALGKKIEDITAPSTEFIHENKNEEQKIHEIKLISNESIPNTKMQNGDFKNSNLKITVLDYEPITQIDNAKCIDQLKIVPKAKIPPANKKPVDPEKIEILSSVIISPSISKIMSSSSGSDENNLGMSSIRKKMHFEAYTQSILINNPGLPVDQSQIKQSLMIESPSNLTQKIRLFECFFIVGIDKTDLLSIEQTKKSSSAFILPKTLYEFPMNYTQNNPNAKTILQFLFPHKVKANLKSSDPNKTLHDILFHMPSYHLNKNCFVFSSLSPFSEAKIILHPLLEDSNPLKRLYYICIKVKDYIPHTNKSLIWVTEKIYCFITYYPFMPLFFELIYKIIEFVKQKRVDIIAKNEYNNDNNNGNVVNYNEIDSKFAVECVINGIQNGLDYYYNNIINPNFDDNLTIDIFHKNHLKNKILYHIESKNLAYTLESSWALPYIFTHLSLSDILFLYTAVMMDSKIILFSKDNLLLTGTLFTLYTIIKPLKYTGHMAFLLPEDLFYGLIGAPGSYLYGINKGRDYLISSGLLEYQEKVECLYICLDEHVIYAAKEVINTLGFPLYSDFRLNLEKNYYQINKERHYTLQVYNNNKVILGQNQGKNPGESHYPENKKIFEYCLKVLETFREFFMERVHNLIPKQPVYISGTKELNHDAIFDLILRNCTCDRDRDFIRKIMIKQPFVYYLQEYYLSIGK